MTVTLWSSRAAPSVDNMALATANPAEICGAVESELKDEEDFQFEALSPKGSVGLDQWTKRISLVKKSNG